jgi:EF-hand domain pair
MEEDHNEESKRMENDDAQDQFA